MVSFYMDNEYNKNFFEFNKTKINNENQIVYRLPDLESRLTYALSYHSSKDLKKLQKIQKDLDLIKN